VLQTDWKAPSIGIYVETVSASSAPASDVDLLTMFSVSAKAARQSGGSRIMRIKVFDRNGMKTPMQMITSPNKQDQPVSQTAVPILQDLNSQLAPQRIQIKQVESTDNNPNTSAPSVQKYFVFFDSNKAVKDFFSQKMPTIVIGSESSSILGCSVSTNQNAQLTTSLIKQSLTGISPGKPLGVVGPSGLPVNILPVTLSMLTVGCPLVNYMQTFFVDFNTGTSMDNTYYVHDIDHQFSPGKFQTSLKLAYVDAFAGYRNPRTLAETAKLMVSKISG